MEFPLFRQIIPSSAQTVCKVFRLTGSTGLAGRAGGHRGRTHCDCFDSSVSKLANFVRSWGRDFRHIQAGDIFLSSSFLSRAHSTAGWLGNGHTAASSKATAICACKKWGHEFEYLRRIVAGESVVRLSLTPPQQIQINDGCMLISIIARYLNAGLATR